MENETKATRALFVLDPMGSVLMDSNNEFTELVEKYETECGLKLDARLEDVFNAVNATGVELIVFDWGGMSLGNSLMEHQIRTLHRWADDHPSALIVIRSALGSRWIDREIENEHMSPLSNVVVDAGQNGWRVAGQSQNLHHPGERLPGWWLKGRTAQSQDA